MRAGQRERICAAFDSFIYLMSARETNLEQDEYQIDSSSFEDV